MRDTATPWGWGDVRLALLLAPLTTRVKDAKLPPCRLYFRESAHPIGVRVQAPCIPEPFFECLLLQTGVANKNEEMFCKEAPPSMMMVGRVNQH